MTYWVRVLCVCVDEGHWEVGGWVLSPDTPNDLGLKALG